MQRIMVASDWSEGSATAVRRAARLASERNAALHILHVMSEWTKLSDRRTAREALKTFAAKIAQEHPCVRGVTSNIGFGDLAKAIMVEAEHERAELIVLGRHTSAAFADRLFGTAVERLLRATGAPLLIVQHEPKGPYRRVLAAVDADRATEEMALACSVLSAQIIYAVHAFHVPFEPFLAGDEIREYVRDEDRRELEEEVRRVLGAHSHLTVRVHAAVREGEVLPVLSRVLKDLDPDLLVIGTHGRSGLSLALHGSFAAAILEALPIDTLVQRARCH